MINHRPMLFTTNTPLGTWGRVLHDPDLAAAILDRVLERGRHLELRGPSYRTRLVKLDLYHDLRPLIRAACQSFRTQSAA
jgi:DNA replication protein DnaC